MYSFKKFNKTMNKLSEDFDFCELNNDIISVYCYHGKDEVSGKTFTTRVQVFDEETLEYIAEILDEEIYEFETDSSMDKKIVWGGDNVYYFCLIDKLHHYDSSLRGDEEDERTDSDR